MFANVGLYHVDSRRQPVGMRALKSSDGLGAVIVAQKFAGKRRWVHLDIAGPARSESDSGENPKGGTGYGVRLLTEWLASL